MGGTDENRCETCGGVLTTGDWPFCPHGTPGKFSVTPDDVPGGFWAENGFAEPRKFYSHSAHRAALAAEGLEIRAKWAGEHDKIMSNWGASIDAGTLENARTLVSRGAQARAEKAGRWPKADLPVTVADAGTFRARDLGL